MNKKKTINQLKYGEIKETMLADPDVPSTRFPLGPSYNWSWLKGVLQEDGFTIPEASHRCIIVQHSSETVYVSKVIKNKPSHAQMFFNEKDNIDKIKILLESQGYVVEKLKTTLQIWPKDKRKTIDSFRRNSACIVPCICSYFDLF